MGITSFVLDGIGYFCFVGGKNGNARTTVQYLKTNGSGAVINPYESN